MAELRSVVLAGGGTGGHIYPLLAFADCLRRHQPDLRITCLGSMRGLEGELIPAQGYELRQVPAYQLPRSVGLDLAKTPTRMLRSMRAGRKILDDILARVPGHDACHGFVRGRSTVTNAAPHQRAALIVKVDLQDFFPTVHYRRVLGLFAWLGYREEVAAALAGLTTYRPKLTDGRVLWPGVLPQGAPTSPAIARWSRQERTICRTQALAGVLTISGPMISSTISNPLPGPPVL